MGFQTEVEKMWTAGVGDLSTSARFVKGQVTWQLSPRCSAGPPIWRLCKNTRFRQRLAKMAAQHGHGKHRKSPGITPRRARWPASREDQPVLLRSRAICRLSRIFSEILQDRHRPPRDLADGLMRNSSSLGGDFKGRQPLYGRLVFFRT